MKKRARSYTEEADTMIVAAQQEGFEKVFLGQKCWYAVHIAPRMRKRIKFVAAYQTSPVSAITHYAQVSRIEPYGREGKYRLIFSEEAKPIGPIPRGGVPSGAMRGTRYTTFERLKSAKTIDDLLWS